MKCSLAFPWVPGAITTSLVVAVLLAPFAANVQAREYYSYAYVNDDGTLRVSRKHIRLYGIHIPRSGRTCDTTFRPTRCATRAAVALESKIQGFVRCREVRRHKDRSLTAQCFNRDTDLSAYLIEQGWAVASPGAPFEYQTLERIAEKRGMGVWGFVVK